MSLVKGLEQSQSVKKRQKKLSKHVQSEKRTQLHFSWLFVGKKEELNRETTPAQWSERDLNPQARDFKSGCPVASVTCRGRSHLVLSFSPMYTTCKHFSFIDLLYNEPVVKKTYLVFITSEGQFFEWNIESFGDTKIHQKCTEIGCKGALNQRDLHKAQL